MLPSSITRVGRLFYYRTIVKLPVRKGSYPMISYVDSIFDSPQPYLVTLYKAMVVTVYFGLFRVVKITQSKHVVKAYDILMDVNKPKLMIVLTKNYTLKRKSFKYVNKHFFIFFSDRSQITEHQLKDILKKWLINNKLDSTI